MSCSGNKNDHVDISGCLFALQEPDMLQIHFSDALWNAAVDEQGLRRVDEDIQGLDVLSTPAPAWLPEAYPPNNFLANSPKCSFQTVTAPCPVPGLWQRQTPHRSRWGRWH